MKKKFISILLTGCMLTGMLAGCGSTTANGTAGAATGSTAEASSSASASQTAEAAADDKDMTETDHKRSRRHVDGRTWKKGN